MAPVYFDSFAFICVYSRLFSAVGLEQLADGRAVVVDLDRALLRRHVLFIAVDAERLVDRRGYVLHAQRALFRILSTLIGAADHHAGLETAAANADADGAGPVVTACGRVDARCAP